MFTQVFLCIFPDWSMGVFDFCLIGSSFLGNKYFSLSLIILGRWTRDLCELYFAEDFQSLGGVVCVWAVDFVYIFPMIISLDFSLFFVASFSWVCASVQWISSKFFSYSWNSSELFSPCWISFSRIDLYLSVWLLCLIGSTLYATEV